MILMEKGKLDKNSVVHTVLAEIRKNYLDMENVTKEEWETILEDTRRAVDKVVDQGSFSGVRLLSSSKTNDDINKVVNVVMFNHEFSVEKAAEKQEKTKGKFYGYTKDQFIKMAKQANVNTMEDFSNLLYGVWYRLAKVRDSKVHLRLKRLEEYYEKNKEILNEQGITLKERVGGERYIFNVNGTTYVFHLTQIRTDIKFGKNIISELNRGTPVMRQIKESLYKYGKESGKMEDVVLLMNMISNAFDLRKKI